MSPIVADDIRENGQMEPIVTYRGKILDGRNRYRACEIADVGPWMVEFAGIDPLKSVISHNLHRRHLSESQRGMVAASLANLKHGENKSNEVPSIEGTQLEITQTEAAKMLNVGVATVEGAREVLTKAIPDVRDMVTSGEINVRAAAVVARMPEEQQQKAVAGGVDGVKAAAKDAVKKAQRPAVVRLQDFSSCDPPGASELMTPFSFSGLPSPFAGGAGPSKSHQAIPSSCLSGLR